jgi:putative heme-binding domain-containing protein
VKPFALLLALTFCASTFGQANSAAIEALSRLKGMDLEANPALKNAVLKVAESAKGTPQFIELVKDFNLKGQSKDLIDFAAAHPADSAGVEALKLAVAEVGISGITNSIGILQAMGNAADKQFVPALLACAQDSKQPVENRKVAVQSLVQTEEGAAAILKLAKEDKLDSALKFTASALLNSARWPAIKTEAAEVMPLPQGKNATPLPPVSDLVKMKGDAENGWKVMRRLEVNCVGCHQINGQGVDFGPNLSEIGAKLSKEALYEAILDPSAGISFGFEAWNVELKNGDEGFGIKTSETADEISIKNQTGVSIRYKKSDIAKLQQGKLSIMPQGLQATMSQQDLVDVVEFLSTLKKK